MKIISIIPARGSSKGIPKKNIRLLDGKPLIAYTIEKALKVKLIDRVIVSTEDVEIAKIAQNYGAEIIKRPIDLAQDNSSTIDVIFNVIENLKSIESNDIVILLQPTSPLRNENDINTSINLFLEKECESVVSVCEIKHPPFWSLIIKEGYLKPLLKEEDFKKRRQDFATTYLLNGAIYVTNIQTLYKYKGFISQYTIPYIMPYERSIDIDEEIDLLLAELILQKSKTFK